jgi:hypothetical protein
MRSDSVIDLRCPNPGDGRKERREEHGTEGH